MSNSLKKCFYITSWIHCFNFMTRAHFFNPLPSRQDAVKLIAEYMFVCLLFVLYRFFAKGLSACHDKNVLCINTYHRNNTLCKHTKQLSDPIPLAPHLPKQLNVSIAVKIFICLNVMLMHRNANTFAAHTFSTKSFSSFFTCKNNYIRQFLIFVDCSLKVNCKQFCSKLLTWHL